MRITIAGDNDDERAMLDPDWGKLSAEDRDGVVPKPIVIQDVVEYALTGTRVVQKTIPTQFTRTHIQQQLGTADLIGRLYAAIETLRQVTRGNPPV